MVRPTAVQAHDYARRPLNAVLGAPSHIAVLRALNDHAGALTGRQVARLSGVAVQATQDALGRLERIGLVRWIPAGRAKLYELNRDHVLFRRGLLPLLEAEREFKTSVRRILQKALSNKVLSAAIYGSVARREDDPESDLDLLLIFRNDQARKRGVPDLDQAAQRLRDEFGVRLSPLIQTRAEFLAGYRKGASFYRQVAAEGERIAGQDLSELVRG